MIHWPRRCTGAYVLSSKDMASSDWSRTSFRVGSYSRAKWRFVVSDPAECFLVQFCNWSALKSPNSGKISNFAFKQLKLIFGENSVQRSKIDCSHLTPRGRLFICSCVPMGHRTNFDDITEGNIIVPLMHYVLFVH